MQIIDGSEALDPVEWREFVDNHPMGNIFQTQKMVDVYLRTDRLEPVVVAVADQTGLKGLLVAVLQKEHNGLLGTFSARAVVWGGPLIEDGDLDVLDMILSHYNGQIKRKAIYSQFRNIWRPTEAECRVFQHHGFDLVNHLDIIHDLTLDKDQLFEKVHKGRRKNIKRAIKSGLTFTEVTLESEFEKCVQLVEKTYERIGLPSPGRSFLFEAFRLLTKSGNLKTFAALLDDKIVGTRMVLCHNGLIYDWYAAADDTCSGNYINDFLPWKVMEWGVENMYRTFDFGGAGKPGIKYGVRDFKLKFGGRLVDYGRFEKVHKKQLFGLAKTGLKLYKTIKHR